LFDYSTKRVDWTSEKGLRKRKRIRKTAKITHGSQVGFVILSGCKRTSRRGPVTERNHGGERSLGGQVKGNGCGKKSGGGVVLARGGSGGGWGVWPKAAIKAGTFWQREGATRGSGGGEEGEGVRQCHC